jgi:hypothetical protein
MKTKYIYIITLCFLISSGLKAQNDNSSLPTGNIIIGVSNPKIPESLSESQGEKIKNRIIRDVNKNSISAVSKNAKFTIYSDFQVFDEKNVDGLRNNTVVYCELYLKIIQNATGNVFSTFSKDINGAGTTREKALNNAIRNISLDNSKFKEFINKGKQEIIDYYTKDCDRLISEIQAAYDNANYKTAIILSSAIPSEAVNCHTKARQITQEAYIAFRNSYCKELILLGKSALAQNNFKLAGKYFSHVDPKSSCYEEASILLGQFNIDFTEEQQIQQEYNLEVLQIFATTEILTSYYNNTQPPQNTTNNDLQGNTLSTTGPNIFLIVVADTQDEKIGPSTKKDLISVTNLFRKATKEIGVGYGEKMLYANTFDKKNILNTINSIPAKNDDVIIFYYSGHGYNHPKANSLFPTMQLDGDDFLLENIHEILKAKNTRLSLTIGDLCNSVPSPKVEIPAKKESIHKSSYFFDKQKLKKLLLESKGDLISTSSKKGQYSFCMVDANGNAGNGHFTNAFLTEFAKATTSVENVSSTTDWTSIFNNSYKTALKTSKIHPNKDGSKGQSGFSESDIK